MKARILISLLSFVLMAMICTVAYALDEAVLTPTPESRHAGAMAEKDKAKAEKEFNTAMSVWYKHDYKNGEKLLGQFAAKYPDSKWRAEAELHQGCYLIYAGKTAEAKPIFERLASEFADTNISAKARIRLGNIAERQANIDEAIRQYSSVLKMNPTWDQFKYANYNARKLLMTRKGLQARINCGPVALAEKREARRISGGRY